MGVEHFEERGDGSVNAALRGLVRRRRGERGQRRRLPVSEIHRTREVAVGGVLGFGLGFCEV